MREKSSLFEQRNVSLKEAPAIFGLWDNVYHQNAIKSLDDKGRWDPTQASKQQQSKKKARDSTAKDSSSEDEDSNSDSNSNEDDNEDDNEDEEVKYDDEGNPIT